MVYQVTQEQHFDIIFIYTHRQIIQVVHKKKLGFFGTKNLSDGFDVQLAEL